MPYCNSLLSLVTDVRIKFFLFIILVLFCLELKAKPFVIGVENISYFPLYDFSANSQHPQSFTSELLSTFFEQYGYDYVFLPLPIKRFDQWFADHQIDFKFPDNRRWRDSNPLGVKYSDAVVKLYAGSFVLATNAQMPRHKIKKLGTILGFFPTLWLADIRASKVQLVEEHSPLSIVRHLVEGNIDATNIDLNVINQCLRMLKSSEHVVLNKNAHAESFYYHLSTIRHPEVLIQFNQFLVKNKKLIQKLKHKYHINEDLALND